jgi:polysaccharide pyruvyl transferase WcaK-like protein
MDRRGIGGGAMTDQMLVAWVSALIDWTKTQWMLGRGVRWEPGEPLKLLFAGYTGAGNMGSDVRVEEMLRQIRQVLGKDRVKLTVMSFEPSRTKNYFGDAAQVRLPDLFPPFVYKQARAHHGVVACEGSMFKSKFANALTLMMIESLGVAAAENKLSIGYGGDADKMDPSLQNMVRRYCRTSFVIPRNVESQATLRALGVPTELGTDTAWTFTPHPPEAGKKVLSDAGWDGSTPVLILCPINPFFWPVKASVAKLLANKTTGAFKESHYRGPYFHNAGPKVDAAFATYINAWVTSVNAFKQRHKVFPVLVGTERLDGEAARRIAAGIGGAPVFTSDDLDIYTLVSMLRCGNMMVSSRYHGIVTCMPGLVPSAGVTFDERIRNLMRERGHTHLLFTVDEPGLGEKLIDAMETLWRDGDSLRDGIARTVVRNLKLMARMGVYFERQTHSVYPEFEVRSGVHSWEEYLPPLNPSLQALVEQYGEGSEPIAAALPQPGAQHAQA